MWIHSGLETSFRIGDRADGSSDRGEAYWDDFIITQGTGILIYPLNPSLNVGNDSDIEWNYSGVFNITETVTDFSSELNEYLANCTSENENCTVPLLFHSKSATVAYFIL